MFKANDTANIVPPETPLSPPLTETDVLESYVPVPTRRKLESLQRRAMDTRNHMEMVNHSYKSCIIQIAVQSLFLAVSAYSIRRGFTLYDPCNSPLRRLTGSMLLNRCANPHTAGGLVIGAIASLQLQYDVRFLKEADEEWARLRCVRENTVAEYRDLKDVGEEEAKVFLRSVEQQKKS